MRQLKDNPDVPGNQKLIKDHKNNLCAMTEALMHEMAENQSFANFKKDVDSELDK